VKKSNLDEKTPGIKVYRWQNSGSVSTVVYSVVMVSMSAIVYSVISVSTG